MSIGGDFYALTDDQLRRIIEGSIDGDAFLQGDLSDAPAECYSDAEPVWHELTKILDKENGCGKTATAVIPEGGAYSYAQDVQRTARALVELPREELRRRYDRIETDASYEDIYKAILGLISFYTRAERAGHAILFNIR